VFEALFTFFKRTYIKLNSLLKYIYTSDSAVRFHTLWVNLPPPPDPYKVSKYKTAVRLTYSVQFGKTPLQNARVNEALEFGGVLLKS
jgi:hypothetical protein